MNNNELAKIQKLARQVRIQAMLSQQGGITELNEMDLDELLSQQVERAQEIERLTNMLMSQKLIKAA
ncbi:hypothetical protein DI392_12240 [Vibrio albus]|uniref:Uncharacterized protein n=1 Tax=Vibrio albus TaxID=2200953 RepID=A0A2U3B8I1_9VIBR|nr:hypothetical protein [Vibrio albus]PWI33071.1 hypothetical protein DI392_12240 [Vibrio albus]